MPDDRLSCPFPPSLQNKLTSLNISHPMYLVAEAFSKSASEGKTMQLTSRRVKTMLVPKLEQKRCKTSNTVHSGCFLGSLRLLVLLEQLIREQPDVVMGTMLLCSLYLQDDVKLGGDCSKSVITQRTH